MDDNRVVEFFRIRQMRNIIAFLRKCGRYFGASSPAVRAVNHNACGSGGVRQRGRSASGYVLIVVTCFIPIVLLGIKYAERLFEFKDDVIKRTSVNQKKCAREAALAVARNWNPGLTLAQQKDAVYKVADAVYNAHPTYHGSTLGSAVPGVIERDSDGNVIDLSSNGKTVLYKNATKHAYMHFSEKYTPISNYGAYAMWLGIDKATDAANRISNFDEAVQASDGMFDLSHHDIFIEPHPLSVNFLGMVDGLNTSTTAIVYNTPSIDSDTSHAYFLEKFLAPTYTASYDTRVGKRPDSSDATDLADSVYTSRLTPSGTDYVDVSVVDDKIKVRTDKQTAYAEPARCNVDIVLAVPVNAAASNVNNRDTASDTPEEGYTDVRQWAVPDDAKKTPIYQMGQALKAFVKEHFYHTRGVNMSLIPYSGKLSISPDRATAWTVSFPKFNSVSTDTQLMIGACLYGTSGEAGANLTQDYKTASQISGDKLWVTDTPYYWGDVITGCPIMFRAGVETIDAKYGANRYFSGKMLDKSDPSGGNSYKYFRMNLNPCYVGYANMLSMRCEKQCTHFLPNPYYMIEPTADLVKIYEMCNALYPIYDTHNVSNFIFAALEWAQNFLEPRATEDTTWTRDTKCDAVDGSGSSNDTRATLSRPSKTAPGRKKAIILLVNKPDWFEPGEMTYLGFNNDFSEVPTTISDKIDFSINYGDTAQKFLDGSTYDGTIQGQNKILKFEHVSGTAISRVNGYYESANGTHKLVFPKKGLIKLVVAPAPAAKGRVYVHNWNVNYSTCQCKLNSLSGSDVAFNSWHDISGPTTYVFPGPPVGYDDYIDKSIFSYNDSGGINFSGNLHLNKVAFNFENAEIVDATLKHQVIRNYTGLYSLNKNLFELILACGRFQSDMYGNYRTTNEAYRPPLADASSYYERDYSGTHAQVRDFMNYCDPCFVDDGQAYKDVQSYGMLLLSKATANCEYDMGRYTQYYIPYYFTVHGMRKARVFLNCYYGANRAVAYNLYYKNGNAYQLQKSGISSSDGRGWCDGGTISLNSDKMLFKLVPSGSESSAVYQVYVQNQEDKHYIPNCTLGDIESNAGVGWNGLYVNFCGDGELYVKVRPKLPQQASIKFSTDSSATVITCEQTFYIEPNQLSGNYLQFSCQNIRLISAEITNRPYRVNGSKSCLVTATGSASQANSTAEITVTDNTTPIKAKFLVPAAAYIKFSGINNEEASYYKNNETIYFTKGEKWKRLMFPRDAFRENYGYKKLTYAMSGVTMSTERHETYMLNRALRYDFGPVVVHYPNIHAYSDPKHDSYIHTGSKRDGPLKTGEFGWIGDPIYFSEDGTYKVWKMNHTACLVLPFYTDFSVPQMVYMSMLKHNRNDFDSIELGSAADYNKWGCAFRFGISDTEHPYVTIGDDGKDLGSGGLSMPLFVDQGGYCFHNADKIEKYKDFYQQERIITYPGVYNSARGISTQSGFTFRGFMSRCSADQNQILYWCNEAGAQWTLICLADIEPYWKQDPNHAVYVSYDPNENYKNKIEDSRFAYCYFVDKHKAFATTDGSTDGTKNKEYVYISNTEGNGQIYFHGKGDLYLMIRPQRSRVNGISLPRKAGGTQTVEVTIPAASDTTWYTYTKQSNGTYKIRLNLEYAQLQSAEYAGNFHRQYSKSISYYKTEVPSRSSVVDFSQNISNKPKYNSKLVVYGRDMSGSIIDTTRYDATLGYWYTTRGNNQLFDMQPYSKNESYWVWEHNRDLPSNSGICDVWCGNGTNDSSQGGYFPGKKPGISRYYFDAIQNWPCTGYYGPEGYVLMCAGITQPINAALYSYGVSKGIITTGSETDGYINPTNDFNRTVLKQLTKDACTKLKGAGVRVYVVQYRKQANWGALTRVDGGTYNRAATAHSYTEIDACATSTGGAKYDVTTEADLKTTLDVIAAEIKNWAGYQTARNTE